MSDIIQRNYFAYNIIDAIYFNQPVGNDLQNLYGISPSFNRRNGVQYESLDDNGKLLYDEEERKFINAVINKYVMDDYNNGSYIGVDSNIYAGNDKISYAYINNKKNIGIELSNMLSNVNGTHNYKLLSAKDIDFDNVILPNSAISRDFNWGGFDYNRRWGDKPVHINNTFELLNVIDYLLCACDNLWNELYKLKYNVNDTVQIWFSKDVTNTVLIHGSNKLVTQDFMISENMRPETTRMITYLDPFNYYTSLNNNIENNFGIVSNFYKSVDDHNISFDRKIIDIRSRNIVLMNVYPVSKEIDNYSSTLTQNINGTLQQIYGYKIGNDLKIYPGSGIDTFINENNIVVNSNSLIDFTNKCLKNEAYFKTSTGGLNGLNYAKIYVKFLDIKHVNDWWGDYSEDIKNPYFIYYIDGTVNGSAKKIIVSCNYQNSGEYLSKKLESYIKQKIIDNNLQTYQIYDKEYGFDQFYQYIPNGETNSIYCPKFYVVSDEFYTTLEIATPNSALFSASSGAMTIFYYKNRNKLTCKVTRQNDNEDVDDNIIEIKPEEDATQQMSFSYHYHRYNIPDGKEITFKFNASYIALDATPAGNPLGIKLDDEYEDIMLYNVSSVLTDEQYSNYYKYNDIDITSTFKRNFEQFTRQSFSTNITNYVSTDNNNSEYKHVWKKTESPYKLNLTFDNDELVTQNLSTVENSELNVQSEINKIIENNHFRQTSYNTYVLNHVLTDGIEQIKVDLRFKINETSKVKAIECIVPVNINKIYYPTINYYSRKGVELENANYASIEYPVYDDDSKKMKLSDLNEVAFNKYNVSNNQLNQDSQKLNSISDIYKLMNNGTEISSLNEFNEEKSYSTNYSNSYFEFTYSCRNNNSQNIVNLFGGWYTEQYINTINKGLADVYLIDSSYNSTAIRNVTGDSNIVIKHPYIFNFNGFGKNYRLHGNGKNIDDIWSNYPNITLDNVNKYLKEYDLISIATLNSNVSISKQLKIKVTDDDNQLSYICVGTDDDNEQVWTNNDLSFNSGIKINNFVNSNDDYIIKTIPFDLTKTSYQVNVNVTFNNHVQNDTITYYVPLAYMTLNSSTFYPPAGVIPINMTHDLNDLNNNNGDVIKYNNYVKCWGGHNNNDKNNHYHPITMSLKLFNNLVISSPYYYDSNEAVMKFNIKRSTGRVPSITGINANSIIFVALNSKYYLSEFVRIGVFDTTNNDQSGNSSININEYMPSGSYMWYDETYKMHTIQEIPANYSNNLFSEEHNSHYKYFTGSNISNLTNPDLNQETSFTRIVPYPVFKKYDEDNEIFLDKYDYDIYRVSDINKINFKTDGYVVTRVRNITETTFAQIDIDANGNDAVGIVTNINPQNSNLTTNDYCVNFTSDFINNFNTPDNQNNTHFNIILYQLNYRGVYGSKNFDPGAISSTDAITKIAPIIRQKRPNINNNLFNEYRTLNYNGIEYEFFEFKYNGICEVQQVTENGETKWKKINILPMVTESSENNDESKEALSTQKAFDNQLNLFLLNSLTDFITTEANADILVSSNDINVQTS